MYEFNAYFNHLIFSFINKHNQFFKELINPRMFKLLYTTLKQSYKLQGFLFQIKKKFVPRKIDRLIFERSNNNFEDD